MTGVVFYNQMNYTYNSSYQNYSFNTTCFGSNKTGCLMITDYLGGIPTQIMLGNLGVFDTNYVSNLTSDLFNNSYAYITLPMNKEGIVTLSYRSNNTLMHGHQNMYYPMLFVVQYVNGVQEYGQAIPLNTTKDIWWNYSAIIPATNYERTFAMIFDYSALTPSQVTMLDYFKFYTVDLTTYDDLWSNNFTEALETFCGPYGSTGSEASHSYTGFAEDNYYEIVNESKSYLLGTLMDVWKTNNWNKSSCGAFLLGNLTVVGRFDLYNYFNASPSYWATNDERSAVMGYNPYKSLMWIDSTERYDIQVPSTIDLIERIGTSTLTLTHFHDEVGDNNTKIVFGNLGSTNLTFENMTKQHKGALRETIDYTGYLSNGNPTGSTFRIYSGLTSGGISVRYTPLFYMFNSNLSELSGWYCTNNAEQYYLPNGSVAQNTYRNCGDWFCNTTSNRCNGGFIGTYCDGNFTKVTTDLNGAVTFELCTPQYCFNLTSTTAGCFDDYTDAVANNTTANTNWTTQPATSLALVIGGLFGVTNEGVAKSISSIFISLLTALGGVVILSMFKVKGVMLGQSFVTIMLVMLVMFTLISWFPAWLIVILVVLSGVTVAKQLKVI